MLPAIYRLYQNYPNPFNPSTTISFDLPEESRVMLEIYDITGRKIRVLAEGRYPAGSHRVVWDGRDSNGQAVASGVYAYRLRVFAPMGKAGRHVTTRKLLLMK
ncbi:MAG TPA: T9SS type A sorting domain-containing protein [Caldithrix sp.]|nr:T9SS type A sorting domain-containing protein [Caldithrix sp.]